MLDSPSKHSGKARPNFVTSYVKQHRHDLVLALRLPIIQYERCQDPSAFYLCIGGLKAQMALYQERPDILFSHWPRRGIICEGPEKFRLRNAFACT
jgi:hypothetical protein